LSLNGPGKIIQQTDAHPSSFSPNISLVKKSTLINKGLQVEFDFGLGHQKSTQNRQQTQ